MKLKFCGAAKTVTGSCHFLTLNNGYKIVLDCGLYQGREEKFEEFNSSWLFKPEEIDLLILSHAHIDHSGRIPKLVKDGFRGDIICTSATRDLCAIMLIDSAFIQEKDAEYENKKRDGAKIKPLYNVQDAKNCLKYFVGIGYDKWHSPTPFLSILFKDAGHILGSASVTLKIKVDDFHEEYFGFTGDIGRPDRPILRDPQPMPDVDYLICESTYGGKEHNGQPQDQENLLKVIKETCVENRGKLIIPAFSIGRTQEIVYMMDQLENKKRLPKIPVFVDSPLAINATEIFQAHPECYDDQILDYMLSDPNPFGWSNLNYVRKADESKKINDFKGPCIIISASGMMQAGRIRHHLYNHLGNKNNTILVVGFCAPYTLGAQLRDGKEEVRIFGDYIKVKAKISIMDSFSAHGDQSEMIDFVDGMNRKKLKKIFLVHGEEDRQKIFADALRKKDFREVIIPEFGQEFKL
ncbi:MAG: MBL fold metallo-hydrolase [Bacteroidia bacterium]|nr:MBL fold metallo-hydrolase [Bacteroidia bacterium]